MAPDGRWDAPNGSLTRRSTWPLPPGLECYSGLSGVLPAVAADPLNRSLSMHPPPRVDFTEGSTCEGTVGTDPTHDDDGNASESDGLGGWDEDDLEDISHPEAAVRHTYDPRRGLWVQSTTRIRLSASSIGEGSMRLVFPLTDLSLPAGKQQCVAKLFRGYARPADYFAEVEMHMRCRDLAEEFNRFDPPRKIHFTRSWIIQCPDRKSPCGAGPLTFAVEPLLEGNFLKHNNNCGYVELLAHRATPQAFSHFTYHFTKGLMLVCDIQGVNDVFTDPQIHSHAPDGGLYGKGDLGREGMARFFETHRCNPLCAHFQLRPLTPGGPSLPDPAWPPLSMVPVEVVEWLCSPCVTGHDGSNDIAAVNPKYKLLLPPNQIDGPWAR